MSNLHITILSLLVVLVPPPAPARADDLLDQLRARQAAQKAVAAGNTPAPVPGGPVAAPAGPPVVYTGQLQRLEGCVLTPNKANDGDSFHVMHQGREVLFRLYFVDCPEGDAAFPERVAEQAAYFQVTPASAVRLGQEAARLTRNVLGTRPFAVWTSWRDARGRSRLPRYYAFVVFTAPDGRRADLGETLVGAGLARIFGVTATTPEGVGAPAHKIKLAAREREAQGQRRGAWGDAR